MFLSKINTAVKKVCRKIRNIRNKISQRKTIACMPDFIMRDVIIEFVSEPTVLFYNEHELKPGYFYDTFGTSLDQLTSTLKPRHDRQLSAPDLPSESTWTHDIHTADDGIPYKEYQSKVVQQVPDRTEPSYQVIPSNEDPCVDTNNTDFNDRDNGFDAEEFEVAPLDSFRSFNIYELLSRSAPHLSTTEMIELVDYNPFECLYLYSQDQVYV